MDEYLKAIEIIKNEKKCVKNNCDRDCSKCELVRDVADILETYDLCLDALEKQIATKPIDYDNGMRIQSTYQCSNCGGVIVNEVYCPHCGQKQNWVKGR